MKFKVIKEYMLCIYLPTSLPSLPGYEFKVEQVRCDYSEAIQNCCALHASPQLSTINTNYEFKIKLSSPLFWALYNPFGRVHLELKWRLPFCKKKKLSCKCTRCKLYFPQTSAGVRGETKNIFSCYISREKCCCFLNLYTSSNSFSNILTRCRG